MDTGMTIRVLFFGSVAERLRRREYELAADVPMTLAEVVSKSGCKQIHPLLVAVNQEQVNDLNRVVKHGDEVALMPPFSGG